MSGPAARFLGAAALSGYGDFLTTIALMVVVYRLTGTAAAPAGYVVVRVVPRVFGPLLGGWLADRYSPQAVLGCAWGLRGAASAALVPAVEHRQLAAIYALVAVGQFIGSVGVPSESAIIPRLATGEQLARVNVLYGASQESSIFLAPAIGAALFVPLGASGLLLLDAMTFELGLLLLLTLPGLGASLGSGAGQVAWRGPVASLRSLRRDPILRALSAAWFAGALTTTATTAVFVTAAAQHFGDADWVGYLYAAAGIGGVVASVVAARRPNVALSPRRIAAMAAVEVLFPIAFSLTTSLPLGLLVLVIGGGVPTLYQIWGDIHVQRTTSPEEMGRVVATLIQSSYLGMLVGSLAALALIPLVGWATMLVLVCAVTLVFLAATIGPLASRTAPNVTGRQTAPCTASENAF